MGRFADGEIEIKDMDGVRGKDVFIIQSTNPPAEHWMELFLMIDAAKRAAAQRIIPVLPYLGYARQDRKIRPHDPISASMVMNLLNYSGVAQIIIVDLHNPSIEGFAFGLPVNHIYASSLFINHWKEKFLSGGINLKEKVVIVSPDSGGVERARYFGKYLGCSIAMLDKRRPDSNISEIINVVGEVGGKYCVLVDDMVDTAGSITQGAVALKERGAEKVYACATHALLSVNKKTGKSAVELIADSPIEEFVFTDTVYVPEEKMINKFIRLSMAYRIAQTIVRVNTNESVSHINKIAE